MMPRLALALLLLSSPLPLMASAAPQQTAAELPAHAPAPAAQEESAAPRRPGETTTGRPPASARPAPVTAPAAAAPPTAALPGDTSPVAATESTPATAPATAPPVTGPATSPATIPAPARQAPQVTMPTATSPGAGGLLQTIFALLVVLGLLAALAWFMKRYGPKVTGASANLRVVGALNIGGRERIMVVEVGDQWIVVGAAPGRVNALHTMPRQEGEAAIMPAAGGVPGASFSDWLKKTIDNRGVKRNAN